MIIFICKFAYVTMLKIISVLPTFSDFNILNKNSLKDKSKVRGDF